MGTGTLPNFTPFPSSNSSEISLLQLMLSFLYAKQISAWWSRQGILVSLVCFLALSCSLSKAFVKSTNIMQRYKFCSVHFSSGCRKEILSVVFWLAMNPHSASGNDTLELIVCWALCVWNILSLVWSLPRWSGNCNNLVSLTLRT